MIQTVLAYGLVAAAAAWTLRRFWPRLRRTQANLGEKAKGGCGDCHCGD